MPHFGIEHVFQIHCKATMKMLKYKKILPVVLQIDQRKRLELTS